MRGRKRSGDTDLQAAEAASEESSRQAQADAAQARQARRKGQDLAARIQAHNEANHFSFWIFDDLAGGSA